MTDDQNADDAPDEPSPKLLAWARTFIEKLAADAREVEGRDVDPDTEEDTEGLVAKFTDEQHDALATAAPEFLTSDDAHLRWAAVWCMGRADSYVEEAPALVIDRLWNDKESFVRSAAAWALFNFEDESDLVVPELIAALKDSAPMVQLGAIESLTHLGVAAKDALPAILRIARNRKHRYRTAAIRALIEVNPNDPGVQDCFVQALVPSDEEHDYAAYGIGRGDTRSPDLVEPLASLLGENLSSSLMVAWTLKQFGPTAAPAVPNLLDSLSKSNWLDITRDERVSIRTDLRQALREVIEPTDDPTLAEFHLAFLDFAFCDERERPAEKADLLVEFDFVEKVLQSPAQNAVRWRARALRPIPNRCKA